MASMEPSIQELPADAVEEIRRIASKILQYAKIPKSNITLY